MTPGLIFRRVSDMRIQTFAELYSFLEPGSLVAGGDIPPVWRREWDAARAESF